MIDPVAGHLAVLLFKPTHEAVTMDKDDVLALDEPRVKAIPEDHHGFHPADVGLLRNGLLKPGGAATHACCRLGAEGRPSFPVTLVREPDNPYDEHAVAVMSAVGCVGYLPRENARRYGPTLQALHRAGYDGASCRALLNGGKRDAPSFGATLCVAMPVNRTHLVPDQQSLRNDSGRRRRFAVRAK